MSLNPFKKKLDTPPILVSASKVSRPDTPAQPTGDTMPVVKQSNLFSYETGTGKENKAKYKIGKAVIPAAVISRLFKEVEGKPEQRKSHIIFAALNPKYSDFLDAVESAELEYSEALDMMKEIKPPKAVLTGTRASKLETNALLFAKGICKRFSGTPEEMVTSFLEQVNKLEFQVAALDLIKKFKANFGQSNTGKIKTSGRVGNPAAIKALAKARLNKK